MGPALQALIGGSLISLFVVPETISPQKAFAQFSSEAAAIGRIAAAVSVRIEGATQGSGVLVKKEGNRYTVLTAWHVVSGHRPGEELAIFTADGKEHQLEQGSIKRLGEVDMAVLSFSSPASYEVVSIGGIKSLSMGNQIFVAGFPLATSSVNYRILRFLPGKVIANTTIAIANGYQLLYSNPTLPGMSGGAVFNSQGQLVGIHGRAERDDQVSMSTGKAVSTGINQAVPISFYRQFINSSSELASRPSTPSVSTSDLSFNGSSSGSSLTVAASNEDIFLYRGALSSYVCNARAADVAFPKAVGIAAATYAQIINGRHGGFVASAGTNKLTTKQLFSSAEFQIITGAIQYCPKEVPTDVKTKVEEALEKQQNSQRIKNAEILLASLSISGLLDFKPSSFASWPSETSDVDGSDFSKLARVDDISLNQKEKMIPASNADIFLYRGIGSSYVCNARTAGVDFPKAVGIAAATYAQLINGRHGGFVASAGTEKLTTKQLFSGAEFQVITGAIQYCPKEVPADVKTKVEEALKKQQKAK